MSIRRFSPPVVIFNVAWVGIAMTPVAWAGTGAADGDSVRAPAAEAAPTDPSKTCDPLEDAAAIRDRQRAQELVRSGGDAVLKGDHARARADFEEAFRLNSADPDLRVRLAELDVHQGNAARALDLVKDLDSARPGWTAPLLVRALALLRLGKVEEAQAAYAAAKALTPEDERLAERYCAALVHSDLARAATLLAELSAKNPTWNVVRGIRAAALFAQGQYAESFAEDLHLAKAGQAAPGADWRMAESLIRAADASVMLKSLDEARGAAFSGLLETARLAYAQARSDLSTADALVRDLTERRRAQNGPGAGPGMPRRFNYEMALYHLRHRQGAMAADEFQSALAGDPREDRELWATVATAQESHGQAAVALATWRRVVQVSEDLGRDDALKAQAVARVAALRAEFGQTRDGG